MLDVTRLDRQVSVVVDALGKKAQSAAAQLDLFLQQQTQRDQTLRAEYQQKRDLVQNLQKDADTTGRKIQELEIERQKLAQLEKDLQAKIPHLQQSLKATQQEVQQLRETLQTAETDQAQREQKMQMACLEMQAKLAKYSSALGLAFERQGNAIHFTFKRIMASDPERVFTIGVTLVDEHTYKIVSCAPALPCLTELETKLVQSNDMKHFMISVRKAFQEAAKNLP